MQLLPCHRPQGSLESAPHTALRTDSAHETWEGFWSVADGGYYTRCVCADGSDQWYHVVDESPRDDGADAPVFAFPSRAARRADASRMRLLSMQGRRPILVGTSRRGTRRSGAGGVR